MSIPNPLVVHVFEYSYEMIAVVPSGRQISEADAAAFLRGGRRAGEVFEPSPLNNVERMTFADVLRSLIGNEPVGIDNSPNGARAFLLSASWGWALDNWAAFEARLRTDLSVTFATNVRVVRVSN